jgi:hypothetical protein
MWEVLHGKLSGTQDDAEACPSLEVELQVEELALALALRVD